ncbi:putative WD repeat-containing protein C2E1P5.05 [Hirsutella rhossiliensis]|uniref:WD repeat-containing protein C2E1P5.05 n=1 Tax=Hirsutella rhossiliensis TaxID=111463 RepID=A0A9P8SLG5_9HYPO|nr:putative WD repeat-containing protein C2E1P5.05 [Hirsutella rhossiliensis]KAH0965136.1 putative WD repeat-containing protein C2E1P5.05 [Hirsutella rhossiliensis]
MSSFFTVPGSQNKRKRPLAPDAPKKKTRVERDESISGSDDDDDDDDDDGQEGRSDASEVTDGSDSDDEAETAAEKRLRLAERYLENIKEHVDEAGFDAADIDRDLIAERLQEDVAETKGRVYRQLVSKLAFSSASQTFYRTNTNAVTSIAACAPYFYTVTKDLYLHKWRTQDLPQHQYPQTTKRKSKKAPAPPRKRPELVSWVRGSQGKSKDKKYQRHVGQILAVAASPDGKYVVTGGEDRKLIVYDAASLKPIKVLTHHRDAITGLAFRRGTNQLYSASKDRTVKVWSLDELAYVETLFGHQDVVVDVDALAQERCVSVGARDRTARLWKVMEETQLVFRGGAVDKKPRPGIDPRSLLHEGSMDRIAMIDDDLFVTGSDNGAIALWSVQKKKPVYIEALAHGIDPPLAPCQASAEEHPDSKEVPAPTPRWITALKTIPYSDVILSGSWDGHIRVWKLSDDKKKIEHVGVLGDHQQDNEEADGQTNGDVGEAHAAQSRRAIPGIINDIAVFERGERGKDGLCVVAAVAKEHRLGRWKVCKNVRNGGVIFEVPRVQLVNGAHGGSDADEEEDKEL